LTDYHEVAKRFDTLGLWEPTYGGQRYNAYNDFDSVEVGNCQNSAGDTAPFASVSYPKGDGLTVDGRKTVLSLWSLASSPLILGTDLRHLCGAVLALLKNAAVLAVDQDGLDASRVVNTSSAQVVAKTEKDGDVVVGLFNTTTQPGGTDDIRRHHWRIKQCAWLHTAQSLDGRHDHHRKWQHHCACSSTWRRVAKGYTPDVTA
jgi:Alpha galactosidase A